MKKYYKLKDNHLIIVSSKGEELEDATDNQNECFYCIKKLKTCGRESPEGTKQYNGQFCDNMKCRFEEFKE